MLLFFFVFETEHKSHFILDFVHMILRVAFNSLFRLYYIGTLAVEESHVIYFDKFTSN